MPEVMMVMSSELVAPARNGRMVSGASVWPIKMLAATLVLSAPLVPMVRCITHATTLMMLLHHSDVVQDGEERGDEDDGGQHGEGEDVEHAVGVAERAEDHGGAVGGMAQHRRDRVAGNVQNASVRSST